MEKKQITNPALKTWIALNEKMRGADETLCQQLLEEERIGRNRSQFIKRIHSRLNRVRANRERKELKL